MESFFQKGINIQRSVNVPNGIGGYTQTWSTIIVDYDGIIDQLSGNERLSADKISPNSTHILIGEVVDVKESDRVVHNQKIYEIKNVDNPMNMDRHLEILLEYKGLIT
ncbi:MAG: Phage head-tail joining protein [Neobacillus sp.]|nr:Phage head-tail joining protein [Neobacillus sp.]